MLRASVTSLKSNVRGLVYKPDGQIRNRWAFQSECLDAAQFIKDRLSTYLVNGSVNSIQYEFTNEETSRTIQFENVLGILPGTKQHSGTYVIAAHYDSMASDEHGWWIDNPFPTQAADDNASGVAVMLEVARVLGQKGAPILPFDLQFVGLTNEEFCVFNDTFGISGSQVFVERTLPNIAGPVKGVFILDCVGYNPLRNHIEIASYKQGRELRLSIDRCLPLLSQDISVVSKTVPSNQTKGLGDLTAFVSSEIPACLFTESIDHERASEKHPGNQYIHTSGDKIDILNFAMMRSFTNLLLIYLSKMAETPKD